MVDPKKPGTRPSPESSPQILPESTPPAPKRELIPDVDKTGKTRGVYGRKQGDAAPEDYIDFGN